MLPFYSSVLTPEEQEEIEKTDPEEFNEELAKVRFLGLGDHPQGWGQQGCTC